MLISDSYLFDAGWLFFAAWSVVVAVVSYSAFHHDLFPSKHLDSAKASRAPHPRRSHEPHLG
jgi:hypothetical protein